eukprot:944034-Alexandrium_andersonii.AAC.1
MGCATIPKLRYMYSKGWQKGRRATALTLRASWAFTATMWDAEPQRRPSHAPGSHRGFRLRSTSSG